MQRLSWLRWVARVLIITLLVVITYSPSLHAFPQVVSTAYASPITLWAPWSDGQSWTNRGGNFYGQGDHGGYCCQADYNCVDWNDGNNTYGQPILAAAPGIVEEEHVYDGDPYGNYVVMSHANGAYETLYAHLKDGSMNTALLHHLIGHGVQIGQADDSGHSQGSHLHFCLRDASTGKSIAPDPIDGQTPTDNGTIQSHNSGGAGYVQGIVKDAAGNPVAGATVNFSDAAGSDYTTTDSNGGYYFSAIPTGPAQLVASKTSAGGEGVLQYTVQSGIGFVPDITLRPYCSAARLQQHLRQDHRTKQLPRQVSGSCIPPAPIPSPLPSDSDITVVNTQYPLTVTPGYQFTPSITVRVNAGVLQGPGDMLRCNDPNCDSTPAVRFGAYPLVQVQGTVGTGQNYTFAFYPAYPMTAPSSPGTYTSNWRVWRGGNWAGPNIPITFTVQQNACVDSTPPTTSLTLSGTLANHGWYRSAVTAVLAATDTGCGSSSISTEYRINGGAWLTYSGPLSFNQEGVYTLDYRSIDGAGNVESTQTTMVKIDWTPPVTTGTATGPRDTNGLFRDTVSAGLSATDNLSGVDYEQYSFDGGNTWLQMSGPANSFPLTGEGVTRFLYRSVDMAGNVEDTHDSGPIVINKYTVFSNGTGTSLKIDYTGNNSQITGDVHSNCGLEVNYNTNLTIAGTLGAVCGNNSISFNTGSQIPTLQTGVASVPILSYPLSLYQTLATVTFPSTLYIDSVNPVLSGIYYVNGDIVMRAVHLGGSASFIATGNITDQTVSSTFQTDDPHNGMLLYAGKDMFIQSTGNRGFGLLYAPNGTITMQPTNLQLQGSLVGNQVNINGATGFTLNYNAAFASNTFALPLTAMGAVAPTAASPPPPSLPTPIGATQTPAQPAMSGFAWSSSTNAVGYQIQIATDPSFGSGTIVSDTSHLDTDATVTLTPGTTYYWRVQAINGGGYSGWSSIASYTVPGGTTGTPTPSPTNTTAPTGTWTATTMPTATKTSTAGPTPTDTNNPSTPAPTAVPAGATALGGLNLGGYCQSQGYAGNTLDGGTASDWHCVDSQGKRYAIGMSAACAWQYPNALNPTGIAGSQANAYSWQCYSVPGTTATPTSTSLPASTPTSLSTPAPTAIPPGATLLGGLNLGGYCQAQSYTGNTLDGSTASDWHCINAQGTRFPINMTAACQWQYQSASNVTAVAGNETNAYSWLCYSVPTTGGTPTILPTVASTPAPTMVPAGATPFGGLDLSGYCQATGYVGNSLDGSTASDWHCIDNQGGRSSINMSAACQWQYPLASNVTAVASNQGNAYSWSCYSVTGAGLRAHGLATRESRLLVSI